MRALPPFTPRSRACRGTRGALILLVALAACSKSAPAPQEGSLAPVDMTDHPPITPLPDPELQGGHVGRAPRRITVAQLKQSILVTTGRQWSQIDNLATSLGQADFALVSSESTEPNLVFAKFVEDGAREVCLAVAQDDLAKPVAADRVLSPEVPATVTDFTTLSDDVIGKNLTYLSTRFWGQPLSATELVSWTETFKGVAARAKAIGTTTAARRQVWGAMCVGMMTDPRFITY
jgi:hypothetical protein